jgi:hypothetical protein
LGRKKKPKFVDLTEFGFRGGVHVRPLSRIDQNALHGEEGSRSSLAGGREAAPGSGTAGMGGGGEQPGGVVVVTIFDNRSRLRKQKGRGLRRGHPTLPPFGKLSEPTI